ISLKIAQKQLKDHKRLLDLFSVKQVPGLPRLLSTAKKEGWSTKKIEEKSLLAIDGKYHPRNYTDFDDDLASLIYDLGGGAALYALNKAPIMLPSRQTIARGRREENLRITVGDVKVSDILENIEILFRDVDPGATGPVLHTLSQDEISGDGRLCYLDEMDEIAGLCEHATSRLKTFKMGTDLASVEEAVKAIRAGDIHVGKELSVAAFSWHADTNYGAKPVLFLATCKKGTWQSSAEILQKLIQSWKVSPFGEAKHGLLVSIASDGDGKRRPALYVLGMHKLLDPDDPLCEFVLGLDAFESSRKIGGSRNGGRGVLRQSRFEDGVEPDVGEKRRLFGGRVLGVVELKLGEREVVFFFFFDLIYSPFVPKAYGRDTNCQLVNACVVILFCIVLLETLA
ncbi:hypothetical protein B0H14DRAFT_2377728, partial [Mycena olivaceomarginata]